MHRLLERQLRRARLDPDAPAPAAAGGFAAFLATVDEAYRTFDADRAMLERSLELSSAELLEANRELRTSGELLRGTLQSTADGILAVDNDSAVIFANDRFRELWRIPDDLARSGNDDALLRFVIDQLADPEAFLAKVRELYASDLESFDEITFADGRVFERYSRPLLDRGAVIGRVWSFRDVTARAQLQDQLRHQAFHDSLTGLANRAMFLDRLQHALDLASRSGNVFHVLYLDLDDFKEINDTLGHGTGDRTLVAIADRIRGCVRLGDTAARLGGDEFAVLLEQVSETAEAEGVAARVLEAIASPLSVDGCELLIGASVGLVASGPRATSESLMGNADVAMYAAKRQGKQRLVRYEAGMQARIAARHQLMGDLRWAVARGELRLVYQPIVELATGRAVGAEALIRWAHPRLGEVPPDEFIHAAEESGTIHELGRFALEEACRAAVRWQAGPAGGRYVSVNVSAKQIGDPAFPATVEAVLGRTGLAPDQLVLEVTETAMLQDMERSIAAVGALKALGVHVALDDFGTGYSSLSHLRRLPIDVLKIDRSFVASISPDGRDTLLVNATIALGQQLGIRTLAEGIETAAQLEHLRRHGCDLGQGFLFSGGVGEEVFTAYLAAAAEAESCPSSPSPGGDSPDLSPSATVGGRTGRRGASRPAVRTQAVAPSGRRLR